MTASPYRPDEQPQHSAEPSDEHPPLGLVYPVTALVRDEDAGLRALVASRRLVRLVAEFDPESYIAFEVRTTEVRGRLAASVSIAGPAALDLDLAELRAALDPAVVVGKPMPLAPENVPNVATAFELVRTTVTPLFRATASSTESESQAQDLIDGPAFAVPMPNDADSDEPLLAALTRTDRRLRVRTVLAPAGDLAAQIALDELAASMSRSAIGDYARTPVLARTVVTSESRVPVAVRAALALRGSGLRLAPLNVSSAAELWAAPQAGVRSAAIGELHAVALLRVPAAGGEQALGLPTRRPPAPPRPLDPMPPRPSRPVRLGWAADAFGQRAEVELEASDLCRSVFVEGRPGSGKTLFLVQLCESLLRADCQVIYLDPHGDGAARAAAYSAELDGPGVHYVRHGDRAHPVRLNFFGETDPELRERALADWLESVQAMLDPRQEGMVGERFKRSISLVALAAFELFGSRTSITDVVALCVTKEALRVLAAAVRPINPDLTLRIHAELLGLADKEFGDLISWLISRLQPFLRTPALRDILGTGADSVDVLDLIDSGRSLIVDTASMALGEDVARVLTAAWLLKIRSAIGRRAHRDRPLVILVDEAHLHTFGALPGLLAEGRKYGAGVVIATQSADGLAPRLALAVEANCGSAVSLRTGIRAAVAASERLGGVPPSELTRLPDLTAVASLCRGGVPTATFTLHVDQLERAERAGWTPERIAAEAETVAARSLRQLWAPYDGWHVLTDVSVVHAVRDAGQYLLAQLQSANGADEDEPLTLP
ncbi:type IV secretory system conjugative DNA transfer family protein [Leifsonia sp. EB34]|uniref:type IV secretory system conjugative DNA transfer family protein n=1 Tax=Leifsonia sp. EB34 TaxID=3156303 RepID=UPI003517DEEF